MADEIVSIAERHQGLIADLIRLGVRAGDLTNESPEFLRLREGLEELKNYEQRTRTIT